MPDSGGEGRYPYGQDIWKVNGPAWQAAEAEDGAACLFDADRRGAGDAGGVHDPAGDECGAGRGCHSAAWVFAVDLPDFSYRQQ